MPKRKHDNSQLTHSVESLNFKPSNISQNVVDKQYLREIPTVTALPQDTSNNAPIDFRIERTDNYIDLNESYIYTKISVLHSDNTPLEPSEFVSTVNNFGYSMWRNVEVYLNDDKITAENTFYPWMSYVHFLTKYSKEYRQTALVTSLWVKDEARWINQNDFTNPDAPNNKAVMTRAQVIAESKQVELYCKLLLDFVNLQQLLPSHIDITIRFIPAPSSLCLIHDPAKTYKIRIHQAKLYLGKVRLTKPALLYYNKLLAKGDFQYSTRRYATHTKLLQKNEQNVDWQPFMSLRRPRRLYLFHIGQDAYNNAPAKNMFNFKYFAMERFQVYCNEISYPSNVPWKVDGSDISRIYLNTMRAINNPSAWDVELNAFECGFFMPVVDITKDQSAAAAYDSTQSEATVRILIDYRDPLKEPITLFCMCEYDDDLQLDSNKVPSWKNSSKT